MAAAALSAARQRQRPATPAALAKRLIPRFTIVPTTALISDVLNDAIRNPDRRYVLSTPPRSGKSSSRLGHRPAVRTDARPR
jgi:hypothetical protein